MATLRRRTVSYSKWGYFFIAPFFIVYALASFYPLASTFYFSFFKKLVKFGQDMGPTTFVGLQNFIDIFTPNPNGVIEVGKYAGNTFIIWIIGFIPQIIVSLLLASWFTDLRLRLKATGFFKVVIYLPNVIMAAAISFLFSSLFADTGPINQIMAAAQGADNFQIQIATGEVGFRFFASIPAARIIIAGINFLMWFGNTTIMLMAAIHGIDPTLYEASAIDGANATQIFWRITMPLIRPILLFVLVTSLIGGLQMFDIPNVLFQNGSGGVNATSRTLIMFLNQQMQGTRNYGRGGALSIVLFIIGGGLSMMVFYLMRDKDVAEERKRRKKSKGAKLL
ncbi:MAG: sugar ABC transporter permease [Ruminococcus sp.]|jgi:multiple sugar transport system permease protein|nr:sugar ABC transporter permease [Ruminococcus sp.]